MKIFLDTNVFIAEALLGKAAARMIAATIAAKWRLYSCQHVVDEVGKGLVEDFDFPKNLASLAKIRILRRCAMVAIRSRARVPKDPKDGPILQAALSCGADYLVSNDKHLLELDPCQGLRIISMDRYWRILKEEDLVG